MSEEGVLEVKTTDDYYTGTLGHKIICNQQLH